jgi:hypothetical protein
MSKRVFIGQLLLIMDLNLGDLSMIKMKLGRIHIGEKTMYGWVIQKRICFIRHNSY